MSNPTDLLDREINPGDVVVFYSNLYRVVDIPSYGRNGKFGHGGFVRIRLLQSSRTTRAVDKRGSECYIVDPGEFTVWVLKHGDRLPE